MWNRALVALSVLAACAGGGASHEAGAVVAERRAEVAREPEPRGLLVRVIDDETGRPVPGARVTYCDAECMPDGFPKFELLVAMQDFRDLAKRIGITTTANEAGETRVPWSFPSACVMAEAGELWGLGPSDWNAPLPTEPVLIPISRGTPVQVRVQDVEGRPVAGVPIEILLRSAGERSVIVRRLSDPRGQVVCSHAERLIALHRAMHWALFDEGDSVEADAISVSYSMLGLDPRPVEDTLPPTDVVTLVVPRCGTVTADVLALQEEGAGRVHVVLRDDLSDEEDDERAELPLPGLRHAVADASGMVRFEHVPISRAMKVLAWREGDAAAATQRVAALTRAGENVHVAFDSQVADAGIRGMVLDCDGQPVANAEFWLTDILAADQWQDGQRTRVQTDRNGMWSARVLGDLEVRARAFELARTGKSPFRNRAEFLVGRTIEPGAEVDTRPVTLGSRALRAAGIVRSPTGDPLRDVLVGFDEWGQAYHWPTRVWSDDHGYFELWGDASAASPAGPSLNSPPRAKHRLIAKGRGYAAITSAPIASGAQELTLQLQARTEPLTLRFRVRDASDLEALSFALANEADVAGAPSVQARIDRTADPSWYTVTWLGVEPGDHDVLVRWRGRPVHAPIPVRIPARAGDPVLAIDLALSQRRITLRVIDPDGLPLRRVMLTFHGTEDAWWELQLHSKTGEYTASIPAPATAMTAWAPGSGFWSSYRIDDHMEARLTHASIARISLLDAPPLPEGFRYLIGRTDFSGTSDLNLADYVYAAECRPPGAARYPYAAGRDCTMFVYLDPPPGWPKRPIPVAQQSVTLSDSGGDKITIRVDPARVAEVLEQWRAWR